MNDCFSRGGCNEKHAMELTLIESTMLMCKDPAIFLQYSFSLIYVVLILIFWITWVCLIHDNFYLPFLRNYCLLVLRSSFKMFLYIQSARESETIYAIFFIKITNMFGSLCNQLLLHCSYK